MNELQVKYFFAVAETGSFTQAALGQHVSQPAISKQITALESEFGVTLFERSNNVTVLTESGKLFYDCFQRINQDLQDTKRLAQMKHASEGNGSLSARLAFFIDWDLFFMAPLVEQLHKEYPGLNLEIESRGKFEIASTIMDPSFDATICFFHMIPKDMENKIASRFLCEIYQTLLCSAKHPLAAKPDVKLADFKDEDCIVVYSPTHPEPCRTIRKICEPHGFEPKFILKPNHDSVVMTVQSGRGYCIFDEWSRNTANREFFALQLDYTRPVGFFWRKDNSNPAIPIIADAVERIIRERKAKKEGK
jgi:DNA-binding transcriptional LysR family regulator